MDRPAPSNRTPFRGVTWHKHAQKYRVRLRKRGPFYYLGYYADPEVAAMVYDAAAAMVHGPDAVLNFDGRPPPEVPLHEITAKLVAKGFCAEELLEKWRRRVGG